MVREFRAHELIPNAVSLRPHMAENWNFFMRTPLHELVGQTPTGTARPDRHDFPPRPNHRGVTSSRPQWAFPRKWALWSRRFHLCSRTPFLSAWLFSLSSPFSISAGCVKLASLFAVPTYLFVGTLLITIIAGVCRVLLSRGHLAPAVPLPPPPAMTEAVSYWLLLKVFASGCTALRETPARSRTEN
jgi:hypothetical protein